MDGRLYRCGDLVLLRAAAHGELPIPAWPDLSGDSPEYRAQWLAWLRTVWAVDAVAEAIEHASPVLAQEVRTVCAAEASDVRRVRRVVSSVVRYVLRMTSRATPFGLFAGVSTASFGRRTAWRWGSAHRAIARAGGPWLAGVIEQLEATRELFERLHLVVNDLCFRRGERLVVPYPPSVSGRDRVVSAEVSLRYTAAVEIAIEAARSPIRCDELAGKLAAEFSSRPLPSIVDMLAGLVKQGVLISDLRPSATVVDPLEHVIERLECVRADVPEVEDVVRRLCRVRDELGRHNERDPVQARGARAAAVCRMRELNAQPTQPLALDLLLDSDLVLPHPVAREVEAAASVLARLTAHPFGAESWKQFHTRFFERYGVGTLVPVLELVNPDVGLGFPSGYLGAAPEPSPPISARDERLLALPQAAALDGRHEIVLDKRQIEQLAPDESTRHQQHAEICFELRASSETVIDNGDFTLAVTGVSRGMGTMVGRFVSSLDRAEQEQVRNAFAGMPTSDPDALPVQLSFQPLNPKGANVNRVPELLPHVVSLGEHHAAHGTRIPVDDLAVGCDGERLYLTSISLGRRVEPMIPHALDLRAHTPPIARFLAEVGKAQAAVLTGFDWGAASCLPFLPRVRHGRTILAPARWLLDAADLPGEGAPWIQWLDAFAEWRAHRRLPETAFLAEGDRRLKLNFAERAHLALLRTSLRRAHRVVLVEAADAEDYRWCGGRPHELVAQLTTTATTRPARPAIGRHLARRDDGHVPGASPWLFVKLYGHPHRQTELLARHVPALLTQWDKPPAWWFIRYRDPEPNIRLRIAVADADDFGTAAARAGSWVEHLRRMGLLRDVQFATYYPETGRWGSGRLMTAAEDVFGADSRAITAQLGEPSRPRHDVLTAVHFVAMAIAFTGSTRLGMAWLMQHVTAKASEPLPRDALDQVVLLTDPADDWQRLRAAPGGQTIVEAWTQREDALTAYRVLLDGHGGIDPDAVLTSLLHAHHMRAVGIDPDDERTCLRLARAAAQAWTARHARSRA
ncbi:lantibiotic dehydratase [Actinomadura sp. LOL_016]|uniref:lantibiotic dehydratase n=1 Tax=unclassified Actinomadura TaxID=2626254 RepID=UPI003A80F47A